MGQLADSTAVLLQDVGGGRYVSWKGIPMDGKPRENVTQLMKYSSSFHPLITNMPLCNNGNSSSEGIILSIP